MSMINFWPTEYHNQIAKSAIIEWQSDSAVHPLTCGECGTTLAVETFDNGNTIGLTCGNCHQDQRVPDIVIRRYIERHFLPSPIEFSRQHDGKDVFQVLRQMAWQRAKGALYEFLSTYEGDGEFDRRRVDVERFIEGMEAG